jgi:hypothetical protein
VYAENVLRVESGHRGRDKCNRKVDRDSNFYKYSHKWVERRISKTDKPDLSEILITPGFRSNDVRVARSYILGPWIFAKN